MVVLQNIFYLYSNKKWIIQIISGSMIQIFCSWRVASLFMTNLAVSNHVYHFNLKLLSFHLSMSSSIFREELAGFSRDNLYSEILFLLPAKWKKIHLQKCLNLWSIPLEHNSITFDLFTSPNIDKGWEYDLTSLKKSFIIRTSYFRSQMATLLFRFCCGEKKAFLQ